MALFIGKKKLKPLNRLATKQSVIIEGNIHGQFVEVLGPIEYKLKYPWIKADKLIEIGNIFEDQLLFAGTIDDELHHKLTAYYGNTQ